MEIDLLGDERLQGQIAADSLWVALLGTLTGVLGAAALPHEPVTPLWFVLLGMASIAALPCHEAVHAAAFIVFSAGRARIRFGFSHWMLYTSAAGTVLPRYRFCAVLLAPTVLVTAALGAGAAALGYPLLGWFLSVIHLAGCTGDLGYVRIIASEPLAQMVEDTDRGIALYADG